MNIKEDLKNIYVFVLLLVAFYVFILGGIKYGLILLISSILLFVSVLLTNNGTFRFGVINKVYAVLTVFLTFSSVYAVESSYSFDVLIYVWSINFVMLVVYDYCIDKKRIFRIIQYLVFIGLSFTVLNLLFSNSGQRELFYGGVNPVAFAVFISIMMSIWLAFNKRYFSLLLVPLFLILLFLTASQKTILSIFIVVSIYLLFLIYYMKFRMFFRIFFSCTLIFGLMFYFFSSNPALQYSYTRTSATIVTLLTGERVSWAAGGSDGEGVRSDLKEKGVEFILKSPLWGYGINNFRPLLKQNTGVETYSHNTPVELAVGIGVFGVVLYYSIFFITIRNLLKNYKREENLDNLFLIGCLVAIVIIGLYMQLYFDVFAHVFIICAFSYSTIKSPYNNTFKINEKYET